MNRKRQASIIRSLLFLLFLALTLTGVALAQPPAPLDTLNIALWPEYDRPEVLVIYRGRVADDVPLPATLTFTLPSVLPCSFTVLPR